MRCHGLAVWLAAGVAAAGPVRADPDPVEDALRATFRLRKGAVTGTGFVVAVPGRPGGPDRAVLVTAAHVFDAFPGADCTLVLRTGGGAAGDRRDVTLTIRDGGKPRWVRHPDADVAALPVDLPAGADVKPFRLDQVADPGWAAGRRVRAGSDVVVPCFPAGVEANPGVGTRPAGRGPGRERPVITLGTTGAIYLAVDPQDGRKGIDGRAGAVAAALGRDPASGDRFVFRNRKGDRLRILAWPGDGFALYLRRLEAGTFAFPAAAGADRAVTPAQLGMILGGLDPAAARPRKRYARPAPAAGIPSDTRNSPAPAGV